MDADDKRYHFIILNSGEDLLSRIQFIQDYTLKSIRLKPEKWAKLVISDEQRRHLENFVYKDLPQVLIISQNIGGQLQIHTDWPSPLRNKGVFFVKREKVPLPDKISELLNWMCCGDIHPNPLGTLIYLRTLISHYFFCVQISSVELWRRCTIPPSAATRT